MAKSPPPKASLHHREKVIKALAGLPRPSGNIAVHNQVSKEVICPIVTKIAQISGGPSEASSICSDSSDPIVANRKNRRRLPGLSDSGLAPPDKEIASAPVFP